MRAIRSGPDVITLEMTVDEARSSVISAEHCFATLGPSKLDDDLRSICRAQRDALEGAIHDPDTFVTYPPL